MNISADVIFCEFPHGGLNLKADLKIYHRIRNQNYRVNGVKGVRHKLDQPLQADDQDDGGPKTR